MYSEIAVSGAVVVLLAYLWRRSKGTNVPNLPPGPEPTFLLGNFKDIDTQGVHRSLHKLFETHGPVVHIRLLKKHVVILNTSDMIRKAFDTNEYMEFLNDKTKGFYGTYLCYGHADVLLGPYTERTFKLKEVMHKGLLPSMSDQQLHRELRQLVDGFKSHIDKDFNPRLIIESVIADTMAMLIAGESQDGDVKIISDFVKWSNKLLSPGVESLLKNLPLLRHFPGEPGTLFTTAKEKRDILLKRFVDDYRKTYKAGRIRGLVDTCLNIQEIETNKSGSSWLNDDHIRALILDTIGGGFSTTAGTVLASILNLMHNSKYLEKMLDEVKINLDTDRFPSIDDIERMPFCYAVILETMRYACIVPVISHYCSSGDVTFEGFTIPRDTMVWGNIWSAQHDETVWKSPWSFVPERFLDGSGKLLPKDSPERQRLIPLGVGKRYCVGADFTMLRLFTYVVTLVKHFDFFPPSESDLISCDPNTFTGGAVLEIDNCYVRVKCRV